jgi:hypothetical protein
MSVISAGTLCGGPKALPTGRVRSYNIVTVDLIQRTGALHVREMRNEGFGLPVWGAAHVADFAGSSMTFNIVGTPPRASAVNSAAEAAAALERGDATTAYEIASRNPDDDLSRRVAVQALERQENWNEIVQFCAAPRSPPEFVLLAEALYATGSRQTLSELITSDFARKSTDPGVRAAVQLATNRIGGRA